MSSPYSLSVRKGSGIVDDRWLVSWHHDGANELIATGGPGMVTTHTHAGIKLPKRVRDSIDRRLSNPALRAARWTIKA